MNRLIFCFVLVFSGAARAVETFPASPKFPEAKKSAEKMKNISASPPNAAPAAPPAPQVEATQENWFFRERSNPDALLWIGVTGAVGGHATGIGTLGQVNMRVKFGRCGIIGTYQTQDLTIWDPGDVHNNIYGLGAQCSIITFGQKYRGMRGANLASSLLAQYGRTTYHTYDGGIGSNRHELDRGTNTAMGGAAAVDFNFPLVYGFWVNAGVGYEKMAFKYNLPFIAGVQTRIPNEIANIHLGLSYGL